MKKLISVLLILGTMLIIGFASPVEILAAEKGNTVLIMKGRVNEETQEIEIDVTVSENTGVCSMLLSLDYDTSVFTLTDLEYGDALSSLSPIHTNTETDQGFGIYPFKITYLGEANDTTIGHMMTLRFRVKDNAPDGSYAITLKHDRDQGAAYLENGKILTKNLLVDSATITLSKNKITAIDTSVNNNEQPQPDLNSNDLWIPIVLGCVVLSGGCFVLIPLLIKRKKIKKWKKI